MDASFDQFGGGGWGDQGENEIATTQLQKFNIFEKIPIPADINVLLSMSIDDEKYELGGYSFNTVRVMGKVVTVYTDSNQCTTYELCDVASQDLRIARRFTVIRYGGTEQQSATKQKEFEESKLVQAVGKLRQFNNRLSLVSFHIREASEEEVEIFKMECELAKCYFEKNLPEQPDGWENTIFRSGVAAPNNANATPTARGGQTQATQSRFGTPVGAPPAGRERLTPLSNIRQSQQQQYQSSQETPQQNLTAQQIKILDFIRRYGEQEGGVHIENVRCSIRPNDQFQQDLQILQDEGKIYSTVDEDHYAVVDG